MAAAVSSAAMSSAAMSSAMKVAMSAAMKAAVERTMEAIMEAVMDAFMKAIMEALMPEIIAVVEMAEAITEEDRSSREEGWAEGPGICPVVVLVWVRIGVNRRRGKCINLRR
jgi:hypothetical protein